MNDEIRRTKHASATLASNAKNLFEVVAMHIWAVGYRMDGSDFILQARQRTVWMQMCRDEI